MKPSSSISEMADSDCDASQTPESRPEAQVSCAEGPHPQQVSTSLLGYLIGMACTILNRGRAFRVVM